MDSAIDLKKEQSATLNRAKYRYTPGAKFFFFGMDLLAGKKHTLPKAKLLEILASIPYREWEIKKYFVMTRRFRNAEAVSQSRSIVDWGREAQDNEYTHLLVIHEKMKEDGMRDKWYLSPFVTFFIVYTYVFISKIMKHVSLKSAFHFNAQFEDHAEHVYAEMVRDNPQWQDQPLTNQLVKEYADVDNWADVFRRIGLDEREHRNHSFLFCGKPSFVAE